MTNLQYRSQPIDDSLFVVNQRMDKWQVCFSGSDMPVQTDVLTILCKSVRKPRPSELSTLVLGRRYMIILFKLHFSRGNKLVENDK